MKAITLWQPYASFVAEGIKEYETRSFSTKHRGLLAIHAAKTEKGITEIPMFAERILQLKQGGKCNFSYGAVLCIVNLIEVFPTDTKWYLVTALERSIGTWNLGRYAWQLEMVEKFKNPIPAKGQQGFWNWEVSNKRSE